MNDIGLEGDIQASEAIVKRSLPKHNGTTAVESTGNSENLPNSPTEQTADAKENHFSPELDRNPTQIPGKTPRYRHQQSKQTHETYDEQDQDESSIYQPTLWWFTSTAFPLIAGTFGPIANLFSVCALVQPWRLLGGKGIADPTWLLSLNACSLFLALIANLSLQFNFARRIRYSIAQPVTITLWYFACIFLAVPIGLTHNSNIDAFRGPLMIYSQSYYYALISSILYFSISTLLLISTLGSTMFHAYPPSFSTLTGPQRTLMLQTISFCLYLALGGGVFSEIENWVFADGLYWADYTLLTIGLGTDFPLTETLSRALLIPYAAFGITLIGLVVSSVRGLVLERAEAKVIRRHLGKEREHWKKDIKKRRRLAIEREMSSQSSESSRPSSIMQTLRLKRKERALKPLPRGLADHAKRPLETGEPHPWHRAEFELMRIMEVRSKNLERYRALGVSFFALLVVWVFGSLVFWVCERKPQGWTYAESFYFTYTTLLTIGYGDFYPNSAAGKPFFVVWSLVSVPAMTILISNMGDTVVGWVRDVTVWASRWTILPEREVKTGKRAVRRLWKRRSRKEEGVLSLPLETVSRGPDDASTSSPPLQTSGSNKPRSGDDFAIPLQKADSLAKTKDDSYPEIRFLEIRGPLGALEQDVERITGAVEHFEEAGGQVDNLAFLLAREISSLAKDLSVKPPKRYDWEDWVRWLEMLGGIDNAFRGCMESEEGERAAEPAVHAAGGCAVTREGVGSTDSRIPASSVERRPDTAQEVVVSQTDPETSNLAAASPNRGADWQWTWLSDRGPLFSRLTETEWIIEKLCFRLEEVLEIREARASGLREATK